MKLVVGLGNPGKEYEKTRHNIGYMTIDNYLNNVIFKTKDNFEYFEKKINGESVIFMKPLTYMNNSGLAVKKVIDYYKINIDDILVIYDDMDFEVGKFKLKKNGSSAGHNGIKSIIDNLNTEEFKRLRIGISKPTNNFKDFVLGRFSIIELEKIDKIKPYLNKLLDDYFVMDFDRLMNIYNQRS